MTKCLLFDCDGILVDSEWLGNAGLVIKFKELGINLDANELTLRFSGWKMANILNTLSSEHQLTLSDNFVYSYRKLVSQLFKEDLKPIEGVIAALDQLKQPKAVMSSSSTSNIELSLRVCGLSRYFGNCLYSAYDIEIWKPDPGLFLFAAQQMGFSASECTVIEDSAVGVEAGLNAGMRTLFFNPMKDKNHFNEAISFHSMKQLPDLINTKDIRRWKPAN